MGEKTAIEWASSRAADGSVIQGATWNPITGCTKVSPACANCYIERTMPFRTKNRVFVNGHIPLQFHENRLYVPLQKRKPTVYFVNSLSDLFHEDVPDAFIDQVFAAMALAPHHTFQVLTKRPDRMRAYLSAAVRHEAIVAAMDMPSWLPAGRRFLRVPENWPMPNVWLGVSVENQHWADVRIPLLLQTPAAVRFLSCEPLLGPLDLESYVDGPCSGCGIPDLDCAAFKSEGAVACCPDCRHVSVDWVIGGGESGPRVRPTNIAWARSLRDRCVSAGVPFFWKQNGGKTSKSGGRLLDGRTWDEMPRTIGEAQPDQATLGRASQRDPEPRSNP